MWCIHRQTVKPYCLPQRLEGLSNQPCRLINKARNGLSGGGSMQQCKHPLPLTTAAGEPCGLHLMTGDFWSARVVSLCCILSSDPATPSVLSSLVAASLLVPVGLAAVSTASAGSEEADGPASTSMLMTEGVPANQP